MKRVLALAVGLVCGALDHRVTAGDFVWTPLLEPGSGGAITALSVSPFDSQRVLVAGDILGVGWSTNRGDAWAAGVGLPGWEMGEFTWHPTDTNTVWVGSMSGPCVSHDGGATWTLSRTGFPAPNCCSYSAPVQCVRFDPVHPNRMLAFGGSHRQYPSPGQPDWGAVWESLDQGRTWRRSGSVGPANILSACFATGRPDRLFAAVANVGVMVSTNGGVSWMAQNVGLPSTAVHQVVPDPTDGNSLMAALWNSKDAAGVWHAGGIYRTTNAGVSWQPRNGGIRQNQGTTDFLVSRFDSVAVCAARPQRWVTSDMAYDDAGVLVSDNGGATWTRTTAGSAAMAAGPNFNWATVSPLDPDLMFVGGSEFVLRSTDGGRTWTDATSRRSGPGFQGRGFEGWVATRFVWRPGGSDRAVFTALDHGFGWRSADGLKSWTRGSGLPTWQGAYDAAWMADDTVYLNCGQFGAFGGVARSVDGGATYTMANPGAGGLPAGGQPAGLHVRADNTANVWAVVQGAVYHSTDRGRSWTNQSAPAGAAWFAGDPRNPAVFYLSASAGVFRTVDGGAGFSWMHGSPANASRLATDATGRVLATAWRASAGGLWRWDGSAWTRLRNDPYIQDVAVDPSRPNRILAVTNDDPYHDLCNATGVWASDDDGASWRQENQGLGQLRLACVAAAPADPDLWVVGAAGRGFFVARRGAPRLRAEIEGGSPGWRVLGPVSATAQIETSRDLATWSPWMAATIDPLGWRFPKTFSRSATFYRAIIRP